MEKGRLKICKGRNTLHPQYLQTIDIPFGATFSFPADKADKSAPSTITQTNFPKASDGKSPYVITNPDGYDMQIEQENGTQIARIDVSGKDCVYLEAEASAHTGDGQAPTEKYVAPTWNPATVPDVMPTAYRYFSQYEPTFYVASDVGKSLQYVVHEMTTGSHINQDKVANVPVVNETIKTSVAYSFRQELRKHHQYDVNTLNFDQLGGEINLSDLRNMFKLNALIIQFKKNIKPPKHSKLIIVAPKRQPVMIEYSNGVVYGGKVEGLGFYVDYQLETTTAEGESGWGSFDVFLNCQVAIIDVDAEKLISIQDYRGGNVFSAARSPNGNVFQTLTDAQAFKAIYGVSDEGAEKMLADLFPQKQ